jgi:hypothetical protein
MDDMAHLRAQNARLRREVAQKDACLHQKNRALDALHWVWCSGGCPTGVHRHAGPHGPLTAELVEEAEQAVRRMRQWLTNAKYRATRQG